MGARKFFIGLVSGLFLLALVALLGGSVRPAVAQDAPGADMHYVYIPLVTSYGPAPQEIVVDHRHTDISKIPPYWIEQAKDFVVHYAHTSHGGQVLSGLSFLFLRPFTFGSL